MKKQNEKSDPKGENTEEVNWIVVGPILAIMLGAIIWGIFF